MCIVTAARRLGKQKEERKLNESSRASEQDVGAEHPMTWPRWTMSLETNTSESFFLYAAEFKEFARSDCGFPNPSSQNRRRRRGFTFKVKFSFYRQASNLSFQILLCIVKIWLYSYCARKFLFPIKNKNLFTTITVNAHYWTIHKLGMCGLKHSLC